MWKYIRRYLHHAVNAADRGGIAQEQAGEMFSVLTEAETATLAALLEKLAGHWMGMATGMAEGTALAGAENSTESFRILRHPFSRKAAANFRAPLYKDREFIGSLNAQIAESLSAAPPFGAGASVCQRTYERAWEGQGPFAVESFMAFF